MVTVVQLVRASDCGSECRGFESLQSPKKKRNFSDDFPLFLLYTPFTGTQGSVRKRVNVKTGQRKNLRDSWVNVKTGQRKNLRDS